MAKRIIIIDGNSLLNRAYYAMQRPMITRDGVYTQGIFGFMNMINKIMEDYGPDYMAVAWDMKAPTFRHKEYDAYKAGRRKMPPELAMEFPIVKEIMDAMHIANLEIEGFEADDIIGTLSRIAEEEGLSPLIITGDKDALQLTSDTTKVLITRKGISEFDLYDRSKMIERYELTPEQFIDLKGLMGDSSDNIPGIPGVGEKTGIKLLKQFGSIEALVAGTDQIKAAKLRQKVEENIQLAIMSKRLATINRYVPLEMDLASFRVQEPNYEALVGIYTRLEFNSFLKRLKHDGVEIDSASDELDMGAYSVEIIETAEALDALRKLSDGETITIKVFGSDDHVAGARIDGIAILHRNTCWYLVENESTRAPITELMNEKHFRLQGHDLAADYYMLLAEGIRTFTTAFDSQVAAYVLDPARSSYDIKVMALDMLRHEIPSQKEFLEDAGQTTLFGTDHSAYANYGLHWCVVSDALRARQEKQLVQAESDFVCREIEFPLIRVLADMEHVGIRVDGGMLEEIGRKLTANIDQIQQDIYELAGETFNINSPTQLGPILFEKLGLPAGKKTKRGYSTSADILKKIADKHPIIDRILEYRTITKLYSTYVEGLRPLIDQNGRIHAHFQQTVAATGRLSCTEPNLQNIPVRTEEGRELRKAFASDEGAILIGADYSQIELRILAHLSGDENLIEAFNHGDDIHRMTASRVFGLPYDQVTSLDRSKAKAVNFGVIYGMSSFGLSENLHITRKEADSYIRDYFSKHPAVKAYMDGQIAFAREHGFTTTVFGRRRYINEIKASNFMTRQLGERLAMNSPIQGTAADIIKIAMNKVYYELEERGMRSRLILQIHDELIINAVPEELEQVKELLIRNMESAADLAVKLTCDMNQGTTWYELKD
ncbi:DNA polymerase I [Eubacterium sp. AB3007]|uniref:DNA polymerase I n=1 Tax=Eubacterium sp. AB3007 TaxID=1392487 RepID=UPI000485D211|nr:DNA polymerase I [Eubacterium sp. AB3007]